MKYDPESGFRSFGKFDEEPVDPCPVSGVEGVAVLFKCIRVCVIDDDFAKFWANY